MTTSTDTVAAAVTERFTDGPLRVGTRTSPMAMHQAEQVSALLTGRVPGLAVELVPMETSADLWPGDLAELGGKGGFTREIDRALTGGRVDVAVHCMKDVPGDVPLPEGTCFGAYLPREDVHDVVVTRDGRSLADLQPGAVVGTSSVRRRAQLGMYRPDLRTERVRGNVNTRLKKLDDPDGPYEALILARAGLRRIGMADRPHEVLPVEFVTDHAGTVAMVPAVGAGVIGIQARSADAPVMRLLEELNHGPTAVHILAERTMLHMLRGHCNSPIAGHCHRTPDGMLSLYGMVFNRDGSEFVRAQAWGPADDPATLGSRVAADLLDRGARHLITATRK
jgi:hydroxymethylbilane synthase